MKIARDPKGESLRCNSSSFADTREAIQAFGRKLPSHNHSQTIAMSNQTSSNPVKVPPSAANNSAATLDTELRSQINTVLLKEGHIAKYATQPPLVAPLPLNPLTLVD